MASVLVHILDWLLFWHGNGGSRGASSLIRKSIIEKNGWNNARKNRPLFSIDLSHTVVRTWLYPPDLTEALGSSIQQQLPGQSSLRRVNKTGRGNSQIGCRLLRHPTSSRRK